MISSTDPATGQPIEIAVSVDGSVQAHPGSTVVLLARSGDGPLASARCSVIGFYTDHVRAQAALGQPGVQGRPHTH